MMHTQQKHRSREHILHPVLAAPPRAPLQHVPKMEGSWRYILQANASPDA